MREHRSEGTSEEVKEALDVIFRDWSRRSPEEIPRIQIDDPNGLLADPPLASSAPVTD